VLLVDDSSTTHFWVRMILKETAYDLLSAKDGEEGVRMARAELPDLVLMDVVMPKMDGLTACRAIRGGAETAATPVIILSTRGEAKNMESGFASGCTDYLTKPIDRVELLAKIDSLLAA
jgi:DNA-binding response OmpR family regulator